MPGSYTKPPATIVLLLQPNGIVIYRECPLKLYRADLDWDGDLYFLPKQHWAENKLSEHSCTCLFPLLLGPPGKFSAVVL